MATTPANRGTTQCLDLLAGYDTTPRTQLDICFDDIHAIANAGLLAATLAERLSMEQTADALIDLGQEAGAHRPGRTPAGPARSDHPLGPPAGAASARRLAVGGMA